MKHSTKDERGCALRKAPARQDEYAQTEWLHLLRIVCVFSMMVLHVSASQWYITPVNSTAWQAFNLYDSLARFCVPTFVMLSGTMLLDPGREYPLKKLWAKNLRLAVAFLFWSAAYAVSANLIKHRSINAGVLSDILKSTVVGHYHMWFIFMIAGLYMVTPFLRMVCQQRYTMRYFLLLWFGFTFISNAAQMFPALSDYVSPILKNTYLSMCTGFSGYYVLGYYLRVQPVSKRNSVLLYILGGGALLFTVLGTAFLSLREGEATELLYNYLSPNVCLISISVFLLFRQALGNKRFSKRMSRCLTLLSKRSFGMYLVHDFINILLIKFLHITTLSFFPVLSVPVLSLIVFLTSLCIICVMAKIPLLNRYVI